jgi:iron(III) transport system ATP-binding protein
MSEIRITGLTKHYGSTLALKAIDLIVAEGEFVTLLGPSGCGKTTTLRCVAGLEVPDAGEIWIGKRRVNGPGVHVQAAQRQLGMVFQSYAVWPHMTVFDNVAYPLRMRKAAAHDVRSKVESVLKSVGLSAYGSRFPGQLSGGQQQRVALARAIVADPVVVLYDEPLSNLDARLRDEIRFELRALHDRMGTTALYVTHDQVEAMTLSDRVYVMDQGNVVQSGQPGEVYERPANRFVYEFLGAGNVLAVVACRPDANDGLLSVDVAGGVTLAATRPGSEAGPSQHLGIRPHRIRLDSAQAAAPGPNHVAGRVEQVVHLGDKHRYAVRVGDDCSLVVEELARRDPWLVGQSLIASVDPEDCVLF